MAYQEDNNRKRARELENEIYSLQNELVTIRRSTDQFDLPDYQLVTSGGPRKLSSFFDKLETIVLIHNMGTSCPHCTAYADGINGILEYIRRKAVVLLVSPDDPEVIEGFAERRSWSFQCASLGTSELSKDLGFWKEDSGHWPGISVIGRQASGSLRLVAKDDFEPGDRYSPIWHIWALIDGHHTDEI